MKNQAIFSYQLNGFILYFNYRCKLDDYYYHNWSIWLDFTIIYKTIKGVVYGKGSL